MIALLLGMALADEPAYEVRATGYLDIGAFDATGDGASYWRDVGGRSPELQPSRGEPAWLFWGDPWATTVNSQGEPADLGLDRTTLDRVDRIASGGNPTFLVNAYNQGIVVTRGFLLMRANLWLEPRNGAMGSLGDSVALDVAYLQWAPARHADVDLFFGKVESVFGLEWWFRRAPERHGVTPSLIARYTVGTPVGASMRATALRRHLQLGASLTNGGTASERFGSFHDDIDSNAAPTGTARIGAVLTPPESRIELGASGQVGVQDDQPDLSVLGRQVGLDAKLELGSDLRVMAEYIDVHQPGGGSTGADWLDARGFYVEAAVFASPKLAPHVRIDRRLAQQRVGPNHYSIDVMRMTIGARYRFDTHLVAKAEYIRVVELLGRDLPNDVFTSSLVFHY